MSGGRFDRGPRERSAAQARELIRRVAVEAFGAAVLEEPVEGFQILTIPVLDDPLAGVRAAQLMADVAAGELREWARRARGAGHTWDDVAGALELIESDPYGRTPGEMAWEWLVEDRPPTFAGPEHYRWPSSTSWMCTSCGRRVRDSGPYESHPDDREHGHAPGCARHDAAVAAWRRRTGWDDDQDDDQDNEED